MAKLQENLLESLVIEDLEDEHAFIEFKNKLERKIDLSILDKFNFTQEYFSKLDEILIELAYAGNDIDIAKIKKVIQDKIHAGSRAKNETFTVYKTSSILDFYMAFFQIPKFHFAFFSLYSK